MNCNENSSCATSATKSPLMLEDYCPTKKYGSDDPCMLYKGMIVKSLTATPNGIDPISGAMSNPPTWAAHSVCDVLKAGDKGDTGSSSGSSSGSQPVVILSYIQAQNSVLPTVGVEGALNYTSNKTKGYGGWTGNAAHTAVVVPKSGIYAADFTTFVRIHAKDANGDPVTDADILEVGMQVNGSTVAGFHIKATISAGEAIATYALTRNKQRLITLAQGDVVSCIQRYQGNLSAAPTLKSVMVDLTYVNDGSGPEFNSPLVG